MLSGLLLPSQLLKDEPKLGAYGMIAEVRGDRPNTLQAALMAAYLHRGHLNVGSNLLSLDCHRVRFCGLHFFLCLLQDARPF